MVATRPLLVLACDSFQLAVAGFLGKQQDWQFAFGCCWLWCVSSKTGRSQLGVVGFGVCSVICLTRSQPHAGVVSAPARLLGKQLVC